MNTDDGANPESGGGLRDRRLAALQTLEEMADAFAAATDPDRRELVRHACENLLLRLGRPVEFVDVFRLLANWHRKGRPRKPRFGVPEREPPECVSKHQDLLRVFQALRLCEKHTQPRSLMRRLQLDRAEEGARTFGDRPFRSGASVYLQEGPRKFARAQQGATAMTTNRMKKGRNKEAEVIGTKGPKQDLAEATSCDPAPVHNPACDSASKCTRCRGVICPEHFATVAEYIQAEPFCEDCAQKVIGEHAKEIASYAAQVRITGTTTVYEPDCHYSPTREEYEYGNREAHTPNGVDTRNRHNATNYDALVSDLSRDDALDRAFYKAVRVRVAELLDDEKLRPRRTKKVAGAARGARRTT